MTNIIPKEHVKNGYVRDLVGKSCLVSIYLVVFQANGDHQNSSIQET